MSSPVLPDKFCRAPSDPKAMGHGANKSCCSLCHQPHPTPLLLLIPSQSPGLVHDIPSACKPSAADVDGNRRMDTKPEKGAWFGMDMSQHSPEAFGSAMVKVLTILTLRT